MLCRSRNTRHLLSRLHSSAMDLARTQKRPAGLKNWSAEEKESSLHCARLLTRALINRQTTKRACRLQKGLHGRGTRNAGPVLGSSKAIHTTLVKRSVWIDVGVTANRQRQEADCNHLAEGLAC